MDYLHLIRHKQHKRKLVQCVAQNDPTVVSLYDIGSIDVNVLLALGHAMIGNTHLYEIRLTNLVLTEETAHALAQGMAQSKLEELTLHGRLQQQQQQQVIVSQESTQQGHAISDIFYRGIQASNSIQFLKLRQSLTDDPGDAWRDALLGLPKITIRVSNGRGYIQAFSNVLSRTNLLSWLHVSLKAVDADNMTILAHGLCQNTSIKTLQLEIFYNPYVQLLFAQGLNPNTEITKLEIEFCNTDDGCIKLLIDCWLPNCPMERLLLINNKIGRTGAQCLIQAMNAFPAMVELDLMHNQDIGYNGLRMIGNELPHLQHLIHLDLDYCSNWNYSLDAEAEAQTKAQEQAGQALLDGIKHNHSIATLLVRSNCFTQNVERKIKFYCALNKLGRYLLSAKDINHGVAPSVWCHILEKCQHQRNFGKSLVYFYLNELPTLAQSASSMLSSSLSSPTQTK